MLVMMEKYIYEDCLFYRVEAMELDFMEGFYVT